VAKAVSPVVVLVLATVVVGVCAAASGGATPPTIVDVGLKHAGEAVERGILPFEEVRAPTARAGTRPAATAATAATADPPIGTVRLMPVLDDAYQTYWFRGFTLRAVGKHIEVWVQQGQPPGFPAGSTGTLSFPAGDCRNDGVRNVVSDAQIAALIHEFDTNIYPKESATFSVPPTRDGSHALLPGLLEGAIPDDYYVGDGDKIVTLVSNVRDTNYYDTSNAHGLSYIAGFFSSQLDAFFDRNVMTIDAFDWVHRTGADPLDEPSADPCSSAPARPHLVEGVFAHEYQHLLENHEDPDEVDWVDEGLSDWAQSLVGYVDPALPITDKGFDGQIQCFLGWLSVATPVNPNPRAECGPENSLTRWDDQGDPEILADYGAAYSMMELLQSRYGTDFMTSLHRGDANGLAGLQEALDARKKHNKVMSQDVLHDWSLMAALDGLIDDKFHLDGHGVDKKDVTAKTLDATVNWDNPQAYDSPGAPSNGADYIRLRNAAGGYLTGRDIQSLSFSAGKTLPTTPVRWRVDPNPPTTPGDAALFSDADNFWDEAIVRPITVPAGTAANLTFNAFWNEELGWDFGFAQISDDGGATYTSLSCTDTTSDHDPDALPTAVENVPGFTGFSKTFRPQVCSLADYAGRAVLLAFRAFDDPESLGTDGGTPPGFWVDDIKVGGALISDGTSLAGWKSFTETKPNTVDGFTVWIVSIDTSKKDGRIKLRDLKLEADFSTRGSRKAGTYVDRKAGFVGAIVFYDDPTEGSAQYAPYTLAVNGVVQPGGS
jgi:hypothetical protein